MRLSYTLLCIPRDKYYVKWIDRCSVIYSKWLINTKLKVSFILHTCPVCIVGFLFLGSVSGLSFYRDLRWWSTSKNLCLTPLLSCWIKRRTRCLMGKRNVCLTSLLRHFDLSPRTLVAPMRSLWLETVSKKINPILHSNSLYLLLSLIFASHIINFRHYPAYKLVIFMLAGTQLQECK